MCESCPSWNTIDILLVLLVLFGLLSGIRQGFIAGTLGLLGWIGSVYLAVRFYQPVARWLGPRGSWPEVWDRPVAFILTLMVAGVLLNLVTYTLISRLPAEAHSRQSNRIFGILPGVANGLITAAITAALLFALPLPYRIHAAAQRSVVANRLATQTQRFEVAFRPIFDEAIDQTLNLLTVRPDSEESVALPFTVEQAPPVPELEAEMLALMNQERAKAGLPPLAPDPELTAVARRHSADMFRRGYFSHINPDGRDPFERMDVVGITYLTAGENLALAPTLELAHSGLMESPGHRANILRPEFGRVGIGIVDGGLRGLMVTQNFRD